MAFSKAILVGAVAMSLAVNAQGQSISESDRDLLRDTDDNIEAIIEEMELESLKNSARSNLERNPIEPHSSSRMGKSSVEEQRKKAEEASTAFYRDHEIIIFASLSLEREGLEDILEVASANPRIAVVFRGVPEGMKIDTGMEEIQRLAYTFDPMPTVAIDPTMFREHNVTSVPTIVVMEPSPKQTEFEFPNLRTLLDEGADPTDVLDDINNLASSTVETRRVLAKVRGLSEPMWLQRQLKDGKHGDFGKQGPVREIEEPDLIEVMKKKALGINWEAEKKGAVNRFWQNQDSKLIWKPAATEPRTRRINPSVTVVKDIRDGNGEILTPAGTEINPLDQMPFDIALVVFDGSDKGQVQVARDRGRELEGQKGITEVMYLMSDFDTLGGWEEYSSISDTLDRHVYLLTPDVDERFEIKRVPSVITADESHFIVEEVVAPRDFQ